MVLACIFHGICSMKSLANKYGICMIRIFFLIISEINVHLFEYAYALLCLVLLHYLSSSGSFIHILLGCFTGTWQSFHCSSFIELIPKEMGKINHSLTTNKRDPCAYIIIYCIKKQGRQHGNTSFSVWPIVFRVASLALGHWHGCSNAVELTMKYMDEIHRVSVPNPQLAMDEIPDTHRHKDICEAGVSGGLQRGHVCSKTVWWTSLLLIYHNVISPAQAKQALVKKQHMLPDKQELNDHCYRSKYCVIISVTCKIYPIEITVH